MWVYTIVRVFFEGDELQTATAPDSYKVLDDARIALIGITQSLNTAGYEHVGGYTLDHIAETRNVDEMLVVLEYGNELQINKIEKTWLEG